MKRVLGRWLAVMVACGLLASCKTRDVQHLGSPESPLVVVLSPAHTAHLLPQDLADLGRSLSSLSGVSVEVKGARTPLEAIAMFEGNRADAGLLTLAEYLLAHAQYGVNARLQVVRAGGAREYQGEILMRRNGDLRPGASLQGRRIAFVDPTSASGFLLPAMLLSDHPLSMEFAGSHDEAIKRLLEGKVDLAAVYAGAAHDESLAVYATTLAMPNEPFFVRDGLAPALDAALVKGLQAWAADAANQPVAQRLTALTGLAPTEDAPYRATYQTLRGAGRFVEDLVPGGRALVWSSLSSAWAP